MPEERTFYDLQPVLPLSEVWQWGIFALVSLLLMGFIWWLYRKDTSDLQKAISGLLLGLRICAFAFIIVFILNPQLRSESRFTKNSRLAVLIDTSLSMGLKDDLNSADSSQLPTRMDDVARSLGQSSVLRELQQTNDVSVYRFGDSSQPEEIGFFSKLGGGDSDAEPQTEIDKDVERLSWSLFYRNIALGIAALAFVLLVVWFFVWLASKEDKTAAARLIVSVVVLLVLAVALGAVADLVAPDHNLFGARGNANELVNGQGDSVPVLNQVAPSPNEPVGGGNSERLLQDFNWSSELTPQGTSTRLGSSVQDIVNRERGGPISGIVVITDGRSNAGTEPSRAIATASNAGIAIFPIGIGTTDTPKNIQVADIQAPPRVFPGDKFQVKGLVKAFGLEGKTIRVDLYSVDEKETEAETLESETTVRLAADGQSAPVEFEVMRENQGKRRFIIRTADVDGDQDPRDNQRGALVEVVDRKTRVLLIAGGPTREFRFLRNQLYRDKDVVLHVWLQSAKQGADQESDELLLEFPQTREGLFSYDCLIAFDPDWRQLDAEQASFLERWVAEKAGGMIVVAGPVNMPEWTRMPRGDETIDKIRRLYPVSFYSQGSAVLKLGRFGGVSAFPLDFTREGRAAEFLWLGDSSSTSQQTWAQFDGVFGYYAVNEAKAGADILANFADPNTQINDRLPIYLASHFYGAGRVFFQASGEMWRVRKLDVEYFQEYYLKLLRWVSQGRLLRDSTRGVLLTDRERCWMGDQIMVQAILRDEQDDPLLIPSVDATMKRPDGSSETLVLRGTKDSVRPGTYTAQFAANQEGEYRIDLPIPNSVDFEILTTQVQANIPDLEKEKPQRNDALLSELAEKTNGHYYVGMSEWEVDRSDPLSPVNLIQPQDQETLLPGTPNRNFQRRLMWWLLTLIVLVLSLEWVFRRLHKLA